MITVEGSSCFLGGVLKSIKIIFVAQIVIKITLKKTMLIASYIPESVSIVKKCSDQGHKHTSTVVTSAGAWITENIPK